MFEIAWASLLVEAFASRGLDAPRARAFCVEGGGVGVQGD
jgi:hypothetical protein